MEKKRWVCHISGQGEKWEVFNDPCDPEEIDWQVKSCQENDFHYLPKSEYRLCDPPEVWRDVTGECEAEEAYRPTVSKGNEVWHAIYHAGRNVMWPGHGYRLRKLKLDREYLSDPTWVFVVEQKVTE